MENRPWTYKVTVLPQKCSFSIWNEKNAAWQIEVDPVSHAIEQRAALVFGPPGCFSLDSCVPLRWQWAFGGGYGSQIDLERSSVPLRTTLSYPNQSNTVTLAPWEPWDLLENAGDSLKSSGEITTLFTGPPETCAKSCSCTYLSFALAHLKQELNSYLNTSSAWMGRLQTCCSCAFLAGN